MDEPKREFRLQIMLTQVEIKEIDDWRFERRIPTRSAAFRELIRLGMAADPNPEREH